MRAVATKFLLVAVIAFQTHSLLAQDGGKIAVDSIAARLEQGNLTVSAVFKNLFSKRIIGTIQSGLPSLIQIEIKLDEDSGRSIQYRRLTKTVSYDIWEERYTIRENDSTTTFTDLRSVQADGSRLQNVPLVSDGVLRDTQSYRLHVRVGIVPITARQAEKITDWLLDPNQTEEYLAGEQRSSGFELNLNKLVSFFVSSRKRSSFTSRWYQSGSFRLVDLE